MIQRFVQDEEGQTLVEYGLLVSLIAVVALAILALLGRKIRDSFVQVNTIMTSTGN